MFSPLRSQYILRVCSDAPNREARVGIRKRIHLTRFEHCRCLSRCQIPSHEEKDSRDGHAIETGKAYKQPNGAIRTSFTSTV